MPENVFLIPKKETTAPADYELRVAAYCRVSTIREEQLGSLENQIAYYTHYISDKPGWRLVAIYLTVLLAHGYQKDQSINIC